ncbi:X-ray repair cross-complementing protein 5-like [Tenebrio molitor]|uniref:X-ray repair cross-complementing protein 5-like n=1 Tax=Tenebrio molitor TaxID=7067 RepID=UPI0036247E48
MPPASKKDCSIILFDLASKSRERATQALLKICCNNFFIDSKDLTKLILLNSDVTENRLAAHHDGYDHINEIAKDVMVYNPSVILEMIENSGTGEANWLEGLQVAVKSLKEEYEDIGGIVTFQLLFITDLVSPLAKYDKSHVDKIVNGINQLDAFFYVVGPDIDVPFPIKSPNHVNLWMKNLQVDETNQNLTIIKDIISKTKNSVVCDYKMGVHLFFSFRNWGGTQPWQVPLGIGSQIQIPAQTMKILNDTVQCKLVSSQGRFGQTIWIDAEDESIEIPPEDVKSGVMRHEKFIEMPDNKMFQSQTPRSFSILCFTDSANVPEYLMRGGGCYCVLPNGTDEKNEAFNILVDRLAEQNKYVIARRVYNNNYLPKIVALVPKPDHNPKCFYLNSLPFADDVRLGYKERSLDAAPRTEVVTEVYDFLDSINIDSDRSVRTANLGINMMQDSNAQKIINKAADKLFDKYVKLEEVDTDLVEAPTGKTVEGLKNVWAERKLAEVKKDDDKDDDNSDNDFDW